MAETARRARVTLELAPAPGAAPPSTVPMANGRPIVLLAVNDYRAPWRHVLPPARRAAGDGI